MTWAQCDRCKSEMWPVTRLIKTGAAGYWQCQQCGAGRARKSAAKGGVQCEPVAMFDESLKNSVFVAELRAEEAEARSRRNAEAQEQRDKNSRIWMEAHERYLRSAQWQARRALAMIRDNRVCQSCLVSVATQVHHLTYDHWLCEPLFDLQSVCGPCHDRITHIDRARRKQDIWQWLLGRAENYLISLGLEPEEFSDPVS